LVHCSLLVLKIDVLHTCFTALKKHGSE